ncbi:ATP-binding protein [Vitiosangium sp. GDMCC 1.1324]|uniref:sensor histidine kinase n=1 Tax=Vitiosangium sp. (strain GDMCC 1.1324) TaxID=2138576 RepID=UPI000D37A23B|nr:ATP-binding protein [Vitiosangium sp. GDMCC 1.1324]PTL79444.1 histidine kinase [Vitiosangium sp. GDMCC 1.1324]
MATHEPTAEADERIRLCDFLRTQRPLILEEWERAVRRIPCTRQLSPPWLLDHLPQLLGRVADMVEEVHTGERGSLEELPELHALQRLDVEMDLEQVTNEYALLRTCVLRLYGRYVGSRGAADGEMMLREVERFNQLFDEAVCTTVSRYARARERTLVALERISEAALGTEDLDVSLERLLRVVLETTESVDTATLLLREGDLLRVRAWVGLEKEVGEGFAGRIAAERRPLEMRSAAARERGTRALYGAPLIAGDEVLGVAFMGSTTAFEFSNEDKLLFRAMVGRATALLVQTRLAARDEAERLQHEVEQSETLALLDSLLSTAPIGLSFVDRELRYVRINRTLADVHGMSVEQVLGRSVREVLSEEEAGAVEPLLHWVFQTGEPIWDTELTFSSAADEGRPHHFLVSTYPVRDNQGLVRWVGAVVVDISERQRTEEELLRAAEFRERFLGIVSHDLRNPLNAILLSANALMCSDDLPSRHLKAVRRIVTSAERMARMIGELLDFTRGRLGGGIPVSPQQMNLRHLVRHVLEELEAGHPGRELRLVAAGDFLGDWDPDRLAQVIGNLGKNALDYSSEETPVRITLRDEGESVVLEVSNAGLPIPAERLATIFEPFRRLARDSPHPASGLGLGLYIVEQIVRGHGGTCSVRSSEEEGTTFIVRLPRHATQAREVHPAGAN